MRALAAALFRGEPSGCSGKEARAPWCSFVAGKQNPLGRGGDGCCPTSLPAPCLLAAFAMDALDWRGGVLFSNFFCTSGGMNE